MDLLPRHAASPNLPRRPPVHAGSAGRTDHALRGPAAARRTDDAARVVHEVRVRLAGQQQVLTTEERRLVADRERLVIG